VSPKESLFEASLVKKNPSSRKEIKKKKTKNWAWCGAQVISARYRPAWAKNARLYLKNK
jgi:hypothetical protein